MKLRRDTIFGTLPVLAAGALCTTVALGQDQMGAGHAKAPTKTTSLQARHAQPVSGGPATQGGVAGAACEYSVDDGTDENAIGLNSTTADFFWFNQFEAQGGCEVINTIRVVFGADVNGLDARLFIYDDPDNDGIPDDAVLQTGPIIVTAANADTGIFNDYAVPPTVVNGSFFAGVALVGAPFPASIDQTPPSQMKSWAAFNLTNSDDPLDAPGSLGIVDNLGAGLAGNWLVRAVGGPQGGGACEGDVDGNGQIDVDDLVKVILCWGMPGVDCPNPGDNSDVNTEGSSNGVVDVDDLVLVILRWGMPCPVGNDTCADAFIVFGGTGDDIDGCTPQSTAFSNGAAASDGPAFSCDPAATNDLWWKYTATCNGPLNINTNGSDFDTVLEVWDGCPGAGGSVVACDNDSGTDGLDSSVNLIANSGQMFWIRVGGSTLGATGNGLLNICCTEDLPPPPLNDTCATAMLANPGPGASQMFPGQTITAGDDPDSITCPEAIPGDQAPGVWYRVVGTGRNFTASLCGAGTDYDAIVQVYCGPCGALQCIGGDDDGCGTAGGPSTFTWCSAVGQTYFIFVTGFVGDTGNHVLTVSQAAANCTPAAMCFLVPDLENDDCADAIPIVNGLTQYSNLQATTDGPAHAECAVGGDGGATTEDIWFTYTADCPTTDGLLRVSTCEDLGGSADHDSDIVIYDPSLAGGFPAVCGDLLDAIIACNDDDVNNPCGADPDFHSTVQVAVTDNQQYLIRLGSWNTGNTGTGNLLVECLAADSDFCEFAAPLAVGAPVTFNNCTATLDPLAPVCSGAAQAVGGRWVRIVGTGNTMTVNVCNNTAGQAIDFRHWLYCGPCGELECVPGTQSTASGCAGPGGERQTWCSELGREYYVLVFTSTGSPGCGPTTVSLTQGAACATPPCQPCLTACVAGDQQEGEQVYCDGDPVDSFNSGCNTPAQVFSSITGPLPKTVCGNTSTYTNDQNTAVRDTDWYLFTPTVTGSYTWTGIAEFNVHIIVASISGPTGDPDCVTVTVLGGAFGTGDCAPISLTNNLTAGTNYVMFVSLQTAAAGGASVPCPADGGTVPNLYRATLTTP